jgi:hypothetical protein
VGFPAAEAFTDSLRWNAGFLSVNRIDQHGLATPRVPGYTLVIATVGTQTSQPAPYVVYGAQPPRIERPAERQRTQRALHRDRLGAQHDRAGALGTGVNAVHVYAFPAGGGPGIFLGVATYGPPRGRTSPRCLDRNSSTAGSR